MIIHAAEPLPAMYLCSSRGCVVVTDYSVPVNAGIPLDTPLKRAAVVAFGMRCWRPTATAIGERFPERGFPGTGAKYRAPPGLASPLDPARVGGRIRYILPGERSNLRDDRDPGKPRGTIPLLIIPLPVGIAP